MSSGILGGFWRGRVVCQKDDQSFANPGHVVGFSRREMDGRILIKVDFANGDRYNVSPDDLTVY